MAESREIKSFGAKRSEGDELAVSSENNLIYNESEMLFEDFPPGFKFGCGSSAVQIEGGWDADGKGPSVWDELCHKSPERIDDKSNSDVVCDSYHLYMEDVKLLKNMGANSYKFSLAWSRILPDGTTSNINQAGLDYYDKLIDALLENGIEPIVVLWHFDLPAKLQENLTWLDEELISLFVDYAKICFSHFGSRVKKWMTVNEPWVYTMASHCLGIFPPHRVEAHRVYEVTHNLLIAHSKTYRLYESEFKAQQKGQVGISLDCWGFEPADPNSEDDIRLTQEAFEFKFGVCAHPLFYGSYPDSMRRIIDAKSKAEGREKSRLPEISPELSKLMKGTCDFIGLNHYTCEVVASKLSQLPPGTTPICYSSNKDLGFSVDEGSYRFYDPSWPGSQTWWLKFTPHSIRHLLVMIKKDYGNPEIIITENGYPDKIPKMDDVERTVYLRAYLNETLKAIRLDGCNVTGYMAWGLIDGWEWTTGHDVTFGIHHVDFNDPLRKRTPRSSAKALTEIYKNKGFKKQF